MVLDPSKPSDGTFLNQAFAHVRNNFLAIKNWLDLVDPERDGKVVSAGQADTATSATSANNALLFKGNDIDTDGDGKVDRAVEADVAGALTGISFNLIRSGWASTSGPDRHVFVNCNLGDRVFKPVFATIQPVLVIPEWWIGYDVGVSDFGPPDGTVQLVRFYWNWGLETVEIEFNYQIWEIVPGV